MNLHGQRLSHVRYYLIFVLLAGEPDWLCQFTEQVDDRGATQLKSRPIDEAPERGDVSQINMNIKGAHEAGARGLVQTLDVKEQELLRKRKIFRQQTITG